MFLESVCHIFCRNPLILTDFYAIRTPLVWHILGASFLQVGGVGVVRIIFRNPLPGTPPFAIPKALGGSRAPPKGPRRTKNAMP